MAAEREIDTPRVAVIGMAGRFPGAGDVGEFWTNLRDGVESIRVFTPGELRGRQVDPAWLNNPHFVPARPEVASRELFDAGFFGYSAQEAEIIDPQQRLFLETAWHALEHAGYVPERAGGLVGVYAGSSQNTYVWFNLLARPGYFEKHGVIRTVVGNGADYLATRTAHKLDLRGPAIAVQTACSTSLVAIHLACQGLLNFECDIALAGGVSLRITPIAGYLYESGGLLSRDGHCRAFAAGADGTVFGDGVGVVTLKRLEDAERDGDTIHAVILGSAVNNDGAQKAGFTAPAPAGQAAVVFQALENAGVSADSISYVEAHGTGTELGDPIEVAALTKAFGASTRRRGFCALGSLKTNVGHLDAAAGVAGLIKTVLALEHRQLPPILHFDRPNPEIDFAATPFYVNAALRDWQSDGARRAGISSFGIGGTNAHVVLEEAPPVASSAPRRGAQLVVVSARSAAALATAAAQLAAVARSWSVETLADAAYTLSVGRRAFPHRLAVIGRTGHDVAAQLEHPDVVQAFRPATPAEETLVATARQWTSGADVDWTAFWGDERRRRIPLPVYPFERKRYWSDPLDGRDGRDGRDGQEWRDGQEGQEGQEGRVGTDVTDWCSIPVWQQSAPPQPSADAADGWLIVRDDDDVGVEIERLLTARGEQVVSIAAGDRLAERLKAASLPNRVICATRDAFFAPLAILQALSQRAAAAHFMIVTTAAHAAIGGDLERPESAVADGLARVASRELATVTTRVVDVRAGDAARAIEEIESADRETIVAYRNGRRWLPRFETVPLPERTSGSPALRDGSVWLVTGGSGGLGLAVTSALVSRLHARVAVISRHATTSRAIAALKTSGADLLALDADVTDAASLAAAVAATAARFGRIDGVVHAAGLSGGGLIALKTAAAAAAVLAPKVAGTRALLDALAPHPPAVVVLFSSIAAITGNVGQADYAAGNAFLDAIAQAAPAGPTRVISINWDAWQDVGMAAEAAATATPRHRQQRADRLRLGIPPDRGVEAFFRILSQPFAQVAISPAGLAARLADAGAEAAGVQSAAVPSAPSTGAPRHPRPDLDTPPLAPRTAGEHTLAAIWEELLGTSGIGVADNFFDLGGDSLLATQLIARLRTAFGQEWSLRDLMAYATIAALSAAIDAKRASPPLGDAALLAEIDSLSDEQAEARLRAWSGRSEA